MPHSHREAAEKKIAELRRELAKLGLRPDAYRLTSLQLEMQAQILRFFAERRDLYPGGPVEEHALLDEMILTLAVATITIARSFPQIDLPLEVTCRNILKELATKVKLTIDALPQGGIR
jgi:hypothetical protein